MTPESRRPIVIWLVLLYLSILVIGNLLITVRLTTYFLNSGSEGAVNFLSSLGFTAVIMLAIVGIAKRAVWGRRFAILCFVLLGFANLFRLTTLMNWADKDGDVSGAIGLVLAQLFLSFAFSVSLRIATVGLKPKFLWHHLPLAKASGNSFPVVLPPFAPEIDLQQHIHRFAQRKEHDRQHNGRNDSYPCPRLDSRNDRRERADPCK